MPTPRKPEGIEDTIYDSQAIRNFVLRLPPGARPVAVLCLGQVDSFYEKPMLEQEGWARRQSLNEMVFENGWADTSLADSGRSG